MRIGGLDHVQLAIPATGLDEARRFYGDLLGFEEQERPPGRRPGLWFRAGAAVLHLGVEEPFAPARKAHPAFLVADLDAAADELRSSGCRVVPAEGARFHTFDPFGNRVELLQDGEGFSQS
ncbi:MAG: VOC family protein [Planctomycetota bacterium]